MYKFLIRPILFLFPAEKAHHIALQLLKLTHLLPGGAFILKRLLAAPKNTPKKELMGLLFKNPVGLAAGFDKDARYVNELSNLGFGFIEIGTLTPKPQPGNPKPRLFRLKSDKALLNRMGFNNGGSLEAAKRLKKLRTNIVIGGNIGKNKVTPNELAVNDYLKAFEDLFEVVDYFVVNVSSPNTPNLRALQDKEPLTALLQQLQNVNSKKAVPKPILLKIAPDLNTSQLNDIIEIIKHTNLAGVVATNTTISRDNLIHTKTLATKYGNGGVSGVPLTAPSTKIISMLRSKLGHSYVIIGVGGIMTPKDALDKLEAGADLVQVYSGFIYEGPGFVKRINRYLN